MASSHSSNTNDFAALDAKARDHFDQKLAKVHHSLFAQPIGIYDIYENNVWIPSVPQRLQLDYYLRNFNNIARGNYRAHPSKSLDINRTIWYYDVSKLHSLSNRLDVVRHNVVLMAFIMIAKQLGLDTSSFHEPGAEVFIEAYMEAWLSKTCGMDRHENVHSCQEELVKVWMNSDFDLCYFPDKARRDMIQAIYYMQQMVSELVTIQPDHFYAAVLSGEVPRDAFEKEGPLLVLHWVFAKMRNEQKQKDEEAAAEEAMEIEHMDRPVGFFVDTKPVRMDVSPVSDLLVDIEPGVVEQALPNEVRRSWISVEQALKIMKDVDKDFLTQAMERATLGRD
ncbi:hypothetical protein J4E81_010501 [Alternaria sp. BMP 2799]|nr:hypothetical protein J4E81_010501 [Alternaria sp. BMP 2799]